MFRHKALLAALSGLLPLVFAAAALADGPILHEGRLDPASYGWTSLADGSVRLELVDGRPLGVTDQPDLPALDLLLLVPAELAVAGITVEPVTVRTEDVPGRMALAGPLETSQGELVPQSHLEPVAGIFPGTWGQFGGLHTWRGYRLLAVTIHPFRLVAGDSGQPARLEVLEEYRIRLQTAGASLPPAMLARERLVPGERQALEATLRTLVANPGALGGYQRQDGVALTEKGAPHLPSPNPEMQGSAVRYLIVTNEALAPEFERLAEYRTAQGLPALVVTREWIASNFRQGADFPETLRMFLQRAYAMWGVEYLLLGGDTDILPPRYVRSSFYPFGGHTDIPTDIYFAGLDGNWNADGDAWYAEPYVSDTNRGDDADLAPDLAVGRAPVSTAAEVVDFVDKVITYETTTPDSPWTNRFLFAAEVLFPHPYVPGGPITLDGALYAANLIQDIIVPCTDMEYLRMYEVDINHERDLPLTKAALIDTLNTGHYGHFNQFGHGHFFNMSVGDAQFTVLDADALTNAPHYFMLFAVNCASGAYDVSCLMERFVKNPQGGSIISVGAAREAFPSNSYGYQETFYESMACQGNWRTADAMNTARLRFIGNTLRNTVDRWSQLNSIIIGDPAVGIWTGLPEAPDITAPASLFSGAQEVPIQVLVGGQPVAGADVCLAKGDETYARGITDEAGNAILSVTPHTAGLATLTVSGAGLARTQQDLPVAGSDSYIALSNLNLNDSAGGNANGKPEAGETLTLLLLLHDVGGGGATGLTVSIASTDGAVQVLSGTSAVNDIAPGGYGVNSQPLSVLLPADLADGTFADLLITVAAGDGSSWESQGRIEVLAPEPDFVSVMLDDSAHGDGNGIIEDNERFELTVRLKNYGAGRLDHLDLAITDLQPGVTVHANGATVDSLDLLEEVTASGVFSLELADIEMRSPCQLTATDNHGRVFVQPLEFVFPPAPSLPEADPTVASDAIALRWAVEDNQRVLGYHVYRADSADGPWVRANIDLLEGVAYFEDRGLSQLTPYWYKVTTVDLYLLEGAFSPVVSAGTMPAEVENFPLPFQLQTSGHCAVGDVDDDGRLEIVVGADEIYVWKDDGGELIDGDNDAQTTGPLTNVNGQFEPSGVTLADLDGQPGLEIIGSEHAVANQIHIYRADGTMLPGWPRDLVGDDWNWATPTVGDVDGDGDPEVVVNDIGGRTYVWHHDGTELRDGDDNPETDGVLVRRSGESWGYSSPALYDLDADGACEIILGTRKTSGNTLEAYRHDGTSAPGFPFSTGGGAIICSPAIADLDHDGDREIIFFTIAHTLYVLNHDGTLYDGFPLTVEAMWDESAGPSPAVGNFDDDDDLEILWPVNSGAFQLDLYLVDTGVADGTAGDIMAGWPVSLAANTEGSPVVGDITGDGIPDIIQPVGNSDTETPDLIYAYNADGTPIAGFPIRLNGHCRATPTICDLERDGDVDIIYASWDNLLHVWDMPFAYDPRNIPWPTFQGNPRRTGEARVFSYTPVEDEGVPRAFTVLPPAPNPFNPVTTLRLYVAPGSEHHLEVSVYDLRGRRIRQLHAGPAEPGWHEFTWDGRDDGGRGQASGLYFVRARQAQEARTFKMTLVK